MNTKTFLLPAVAMATFSLHAQPAKLLFDLHPVLAPGATIAGHVFDRFTTVDEAVINDAGEVAFVAHWQAYGRGKQPASAVFTLHRLVASNEGTIDGKNILGIITDGHLAISPAGVVAYEAFYDTGDVPGIFVERQYALTPAELPNLRNDGFTVNDDGTVTMGARAEAPPCSEVPARPAPPRGIRFTPPRLPRQIPLTIGQPQPTPPAARAGYFCNALPMLSSNAKGQVVIPVNTGAGPYLFIATPEAQHR